MLNSLPGLKKLTLLTYSLIALLLCFFIWQLLANADMPIKEVLVKGEYQHIDDDQINLIANEYLSGNFFTINLRNTQQAFKKLPWVRDVSIRRKWPDKLIIAIEEHNVIGRWGNVGLINDRGRYLMLLTKKNSQFSMGKNL